ncbi:MAG: hypothetical protein RL885_23145 [Planctomycetota bacterium]
MNGHPKRARQGRPNKGRGPRRHAPVRWPEVEPDLEWQVGIRRLARRSRDERGRLYVPQLLVVVEKPEDMLVRAVVLPSDPKDPEWRRAFKEAVEKPRFGDPRLPEHLTVETRDLLKAYSGGLPRELRLQTGPVEGVDHWWSELALEDVEEAPLPDPVRWPRDFWNDRNTMWAGATCLLKRKPWEISTHWQPMLIDLNRFGREQVVAGAIGHRGAEDGIFVVDSLIDYDLLAETFGEGPPRWWAGGVHVLALTLEEPDELPPMRVKEALAGGWEAYDEGVIPVLYQLDEHGRRQEATTDDCLTLAVCAEALSRFTVKHRQIFDAVLPPAPQTVEIELEDTLPGEIVTVTCPPPG